MFFIGAQSESPAFEKSEKSWWSYNHCKRYWPSPARLISWGPVCLLWWTLHSRPWSHIDNLEIGHHRQKQISYTYKPFYFRSRQDIRSFSEVKPCLVELLNWIEEHLLISQGVFSACKFSQRFSRFLQYSVNFFHLVLCLPPVLLQVLPASCQSFTMLHNLLFKPFNFVK